MSSVQLLEPSVEFKPLQKNEFHFFMEDFHGTDKLLSTGDGKHIADYVHVKIFIYFIFAVFYYFAILLIFTLKTLKNRFFLQRTFFWLAEYCHHFRTP